MTYCRPASSRARMNWRTPQRRSHLIIMETLTNAFPLPETELRKLDDVKRSIEPARFPSGAEVTGMVLRVAALTIAGLGIYLAFRGTERRGLSALLHKAGWR